jgi:hypothetical protein
MTRQPLPRAELLDMRSVLERSLQRQQQRFAEHPNPEAEHHADMLAAQIAKINEELKG